jgi:hypothetical protein
VRPRERIKRASGMAWRGSVRGEKAPKALPIISCMLHQGQIHGVSHERRGINSHTEASNQRSHLSMKHRKSMTSTSHIYNAQDYPLDAEWSKTLCNGSCMSLTQTWDFWGASAAGFIRAHAAPDEDLRGALFTLSHASWRTLCRSRCHRRRRRSRYEDVNASMHREEQL